MGRRSDFGKKSKEVCTKPSRKSAGTGKRGCTKLSRNLSKAGRALHEIESEFVGERGKRAHEIMSELVEKMEEMPHETESEFGESRGEALHEIKSDFTGAITADRGRGGGGLSFPVRRKALRAEDDHLPQIEIVAMVGAFYRLLDMVHEFSMLRTRSVWRQKRSRSMPTDVCSVCPRILARRSAHWSAGAKNSFMSFARRAACSAEICAGRRCRCPRNLCAAAQHSPFERG